MGINFCFWHQPPQLQRGGKLINICFESFLRRTDQHHLVLGCNVLHQLWEIFPQTLWIALVSLRHLQHVSNVMREVYYSAIVETNKWLGTEGMEPYIKCH